MVFQLGIVFENVEHCQKRDPFETCAHTIFAMTQRMDFQVVLEREGHFTAKPFKLAVSLRQWGKSSSNAFLNEHQTAQLKILL